MTRRPPMQQKPNTFHWAALATGSEETTGLPAEADGKRFWGAE